MRAQERKIVRPIEVSIKLADGADVFLTNVRPGGIERSGLGYDILSKRNPKLVYCALTGYGPGSLSAS